MKSFLAVMVCVCFFSLQMPAQSGKATRPRVVAEPTPATDAQSQTTVSKAPPTLKGDTRPSVQTTQATVGDVPAQDDDEVVRVETNVVTIPASVLDRDGRFITGLQKEDFQIFENGVEQKIEEFSTVQMPFTVVLLIDVSPSTEFEIDEIHRAAIAFVDQLRNEDKVMVISFDEKVRVLSPPTNNRAILRNAIRKAEIGSGTSLYEAVDLVINRELPRIQGRKAVVLFTDGVDTASRQATYQSTVRASEEIDALIYPIRYNTYDRNKDLGSGSSNSKSGGIMEKIAGVIFNGGIQIGDDDQNGAAGTSRAEYETGLRYLEDLARRSGGRKYEANRDLSAAFSGIAEELRRQYTLGYYPEKAGQKGERRAIRVRVKRQNVVVRAKDSYTIGDVDRKFAGK